MTFKLRDNVPIPALGEPKYRWPFGQMKVGQSYDFPMRRDWKPACKAARAVGQRRGWKFRVKWDDNHLDEESGELKPLGRIWRIA